MTKFTPAVLSKAASDLADRSPLLDRAPLRALASALKVVPFKQASQLAYPGASVTHRVRLAMKLAAAVKRANGMAGCSPVSAAAPTTPKVSTPMSFTGLPSAGANFAR